MKTPPLLLGATLVFWGWQTGFLGSGVVMAAVLEGSRLIKARWEFSEDDFRRIWNLCAFLFLGAAVYAFASSQTPSALIGFFQAPSPASLQDAANRSTRPALLLFQWLPMVFFLIAAAQAFSRRDTIEYTTFSLIARRRKARQTQGPQPPSAGLNVTYPYFAACLVGSCVARVPNLGFYAGLCALLAWALWFERSRRFAVPLWAGALIVALALGFAGHRGLSQLQKLVENYNPDWLSRLTGRSLDPKEARTTLGQIGKLKLSGKIVLRVYPKDASPVPPLLREASYRSFRSTTWYGAGATDDFGEVPTDPDGSTWRLLPGKRTLGLVTIAGYLPEGRGLLALPHGTARIENLPVTMLKTNALGTVLADQGPGLVFYDAHFGAGTTIDSPPGPEDLVVPEREDEALAVIVTKLGLVGQAPDRILGAVGGFFSQEFRYSTDRGMGSPSQTNQTALSRFLLSSRSGHCEYFATATVLLLRKAGLPARYAVGYAVQEKSGKKYVVRQRHAHAWCLVWGDGVWQDFDTTPAAWFEIEAQRNSWFEAMSDVWSNVWFGFSKWRWGQANLRGYLPWILGPVLLVPAAQLILRRKWKRSGERPQTAMSAPAWPGLNSEFYLLEERLAKMARQRERCETLSCWLLRVVGRLPSGVAPETLGRLLQLHYRYRFDPAGLHQPDRESLRNGVESCLKATKKKPGSSVRG